MGIGTSLWAYILCQTNVLQPRNYQSTSDFHSVVNAVQTKPDWMHEVKVEIEGGH